MDIGRVSRFGAPARSLSGAGRLGDGVGRQTAAYADHRTADGSTDRPARTPPGDAPGARRLLQSALALGHQQRDVLVLGREHLASPPFLRSPPWVARPIYSSSSGLSSSTSSSSDRPV